jgi:hypothetical protein
MKKLLILIAAPLLWLGLATPAQASTYWVTKPFSRDYVPTYNRLGTSLGITAATRWNNGTGLNVKAVGYEPAMGITLVWSSARAGQSVGGWIEYAEAGGEITDCTVKVNTRVGTSGKPYGKWLEAIVSHEFGHCLGHLQHADSPHIMRTHISKSGTLAGYNYRPTSTDLSRVRLGMATN